MTLTLLIDLDDTLLPDSAEKFLPAYLEKLTKHLAALAPQEQVKEALFTATWQAVDNVHPVVTIKQTFDKHFYPTLHTTAIELEPVLDDFYTNIYPSLSPISTPDPEVIRFIEDSFAKGYRVVIATNPIFPRAAVCERLRWAGLPPEKYPFDLITSYEDFHFTKPHPAYYAEILAQLGWPEGPVLMVGNDQSLDIEPAKKLGLATFWVLEDHLSAPQQGSHGAGKIEEIHPWIEAKGLPALESNFNHWEASLEILSVTPAALDTLLANMPPEIWKTKQGSTEWSLTETICHLRDVDQEVHLPRFQDVSNSPAPFLPAIDADTWAEERDYQSQNGPEALHSFFRARESLLEMLASLSPEIHQKEIRHSIFGPTTAAEILHIAARHDRLHIQQVLTLLK